MISCTSHVKLRAHERSVYALSLTCLTKTSRCTGKDKSKGEVHPVTDHEDPEVE